MQLEKDIGKMKIVLGVHWNCCVFGLGVTLDDIGIYLTILWFVIGLESAITDSEEGE